jgi:indole-3-glycerol phosphate synthase
MGFLTEKVAEVRRSLESHPLDDASNMARALSLPPTRNFTGAIRTGGPGVIAEVKRASPGAGDIAIDREPGDQAREYEEAGAVAISVLTDERDFRGSLADVRVVRVATSVPLLRKDFLLHPSQLIESRAAGADAVLLIASCLGDSELDAMMSAAADLGLAVLLETHSDRDLDRALATDAPIVGINSRDLETLEVDLDGALGRLARIPAERTCVLESGITGREQAAAAFRAGAAAILVGEMLMRAEDPVATLRELMEQDPVG